MPRASSVGGDIHDRTTFAVPSVNSHPKPRPLAQPTSAITATDTAVSDPPAMRNALKVPPHRHASAIATKPIASSDGSFTCDDSAISTVPASSIAIGLQRSHSSRCRRPLHRPRESGPAASTPRRANSVPASISPSISASLWMPATRCMNSSGLHGPSHSALTSATPQRRARRGVAQTINPTPSSTISRWHSTAATMLSPVTVEMPRPIHRNNGPYGAGVSRHRLGTDSVNTWSSPSPGAGPTRYGSSPMRAIWLCAR